MNTKFLQKIRDVLIAILLFLTLCVGGVYVYSAYFEKPYLSYAPLPFPITAKTVYPGGVATATATRCNTSNSILVYTSTRQLKRENSSQAALILESVVITIAPGCSTVSTRVNVIPDETPPGFYRFSGVAVFKGLMVDHEVPWNTDVFEVLAKLPPVAVAAPLVLPIENATVKIEAQPK